MHRTFLYVACSEWWLRFLDNTMQFSSPADSGRITFIAVFTVVVIAGAALLIWRTRRHKGPLWKQGVVVLLALALLGWLVWFTVTGQTKVPLLRTGFRMVVFSVIIMIVVLFFRRGMLGDRELSDILFARRKAAGKEAAQ